MLAHCGRVDHRNSPHMSLGMAVPFTGCSGSGAEHPCVSFSPPRIGRKKRNRVVQLMSKGAIFMISIFLVSCTGAAVSYLFGAHSVGNWIAALALILSGWAALGHLITLDDDMPGEWSNPLRSRAVWRRSLVELTVKLLALPVFVIWQQ